jgi:cation:H+ antiporter
MEFMEFSVPFLTGVFIVAGAIIAIFGSMMTRIADRLADATGLGEALMGAIFLGGSTSIPGVITSVTAAYEGYPKLAISNAIGGIAAQTAFLAIADIAYRKANLEHAAASIANMMQGTLLVGLLALSILGVVGPQGTFFQVHPISLLLLAGYIFGLLQISKAETEPMWRAKKTRETQIDETKIGHMSRYELVLAWLKFAILGIIVGFAGYAVAKSGIALSNMVGISQAIVGGLLTAVITSLPELVTSVSAVRQGALTLAVGGVIGGNCFDVLFLSFSDFAYRGGSVYAVLDQEQLFMVSSTILLTGVLLLGLLRREKHGIANIGFESFLIIVIYIAMFVSIYAF